MKKPSFLALLGKKIPEKLSGLSVRAFWQNDSPLSPNTPLAEKIRQIVFDGSLMLSLERCGEAVEMAQVGGREDHRSFLQRVSSTSST